jgi:hypothetical protein
MSNLIKERRKKSYNLGQLKTPRDWERETVVVYSMKFLLFPIAGFEPTKSGVHTRKSLLGK